MSITEDILAAYADDQLCGTEKDRVAAAIAADPALADKVAAHRALKARLAAHYAPLAERQVPSHLAALLAGAQDERGEHGRDGEVISFAAARQKRGLVPMLRRWGPIAGPALAASLLLAVVQPWRSATPDGYASLRLAAALDNQLVATQPNGAEARILLSFKREGGSLCRAWRGKEAGGIACRDETGWKIEQKFALSAAPGGEFRQAESETDLLAAAQDMAVGRALDADEERSAKERDWKR